MSSNPIDWSISMVPDMSWVKSLMLQERISASQWACVANQNQSIQNLLISENETGSNNRPPKLNHMNDYPSWKGRFQNYVLGQNTELWTCFSTAYNDTLEEAGSNATTLVTMAENDKKAYDLEKKAFAILTQALHKDIYHQFAHCTRTKALWDILVNRGEGNAATRKTRHDLLKKEFEGFMFEIVARFADALPPKWSPFIELLKHTGVLDTVSIYEFVQKLENKDAEEIRKAKLILVPQNPEMYFGGIAPAASTSQQPKIQTAYVSNAFDPNSYFGGVVAQPQFDINAYLPKPQVATPQPQFDINTYLPKPQVATPQPQFDINAYLPKPQVATPQPQFDPTAYFSKQPQAQPQQAFYGNKPDTSNLSKVSVEAARDHIEILTTMVNAYSGLVASQIGHINLTNEDYQQIDRDEMELMDIKWAFASAVRRAKDYMS
ncbi:hypothetical protein HanIR_Chr15g0749581 [Helianthus annuus]|nr:hypothetical protein HanIR_Chr15g0749581 [Helianthus annuus]